MVPESEHIQFESKTIFTKPKLVVSRCLGFAACRWNGVTIPSEIINILKSHCHFETVCPEVEIGLGVPRDPIRIINPQGKRILFQPSTGRDISQEMDDFSHKFLSNIDQVDGFILKSKSPSCGIKDVKIYPRAEKSPVAARGQGFFGEMVLKKFPDKVVEDEARLTNFRIRDHFLITLFLLSRFRKLENSFSVHQLVIFHSNHKLILMAYSQKGLKRMGQIVAQQKKMKIPDLIRQYKYELLKAIAKIPRFTSHINVLMHTFGYISKQITSREKHFFLDILEDYRHNHIPLSVPVGILKSWLIRFNEKYLMDQFYFEPYPQELMQITDSGKGRSLKS